MQRIYFTGYLNDDCWKIILDKLTLKDVLSVGQVCRQWQALVQRYLQDVRLRVETITNVWDIEEQSRRRKCKILSLKGLKEKDNRVLHFNTILKQWGESIVELVYDARFANELILWNLGAECPNIQDITFVRLQWQHQSCSWAVNYKHLKRLCFENCSIQDSCVSELIKNNNIEELVFRMTDSVTGSFLLAEVEDKNFGALTNLNTLILSRCSNLNFKYLLESGNNLVKVKRLELRDLPDSVHQKAEMILVKMPHLEHLTIDCKEYLLTEEVIQAVSGLSRLQHLGWHKGIVFSGYELEAALKDTSRLKPRSHPGAPAQRVFGAGAQRVFGAPAQRVFGAPAQRVFGAGAQRVSGGRLQEHLREVLLRLGAIDHDQNP